MDRCGSPSSRGFRSRRALLLVVASALALARSAAAQSSPADPRSEGTKRMAALLAEIAESIDPMEVRFLNAERAVVLRSRLEKHLGRASEAQARVRLARELQNSNLLDEAFAELDLAEQRLEAVRNLDLRRTLAREIESLRALGWLRRGELENCLERHGCESCILPIRPGAVHVAPRGSETAIPILERLLAEDPEDLESRWLLNLAHMTLGTWPDGLPPELVIPPSAFASDAEFPRFTDVARECGVDWTSLSGGVVADDLDGDGRIDLVLTSFGLRDPLQVYRSRGDGTFEERSSAAGLEGISGGLNVVHGDYDNDGDVDLFVLRGAWFGEEGRIPNSLLRNRGDACFDDVTVEAGVFSRHPTQTAAFADFDGDGWLDLVIGNESRSKHLAHPCELYLNRRDGTFADVAAAVNADLVEFVKAVAPGDFDNDGRIDLFFSVRSGPNVLRQNVKVEQAPGFRFQDVTFMAGVDQPQMAFPAWFFDYDNDGWQDLFVAPNSSFSADRSDDIPRLYLNKPTRSEVPALYRNLGDGTFREVARDAGLDRALFSMGSNYGDIDNDGWLDVYLGNGSPDLGALLPNRMFRNDGGRRFQDVTTSGGFGHLQKGHGIAFADFDNDGDQDVFADFGGAYTGDVYPPCLFENPGNANRWITLRLRGVKANRSGVGARIHVRVAQGEAERSIHVVAGTGGSFGSSSLQQEIGLGAAERIVAVEILWPGSGTRQRLEGLPLDRFVEVTEGSRDVKLLDPPRFRLGGARR